MIDVFVEILCAQDAAVQQIPQRPNHLLPELRVGVNIEPPQGAEEFISPSPDSAHGAQGLNDDSWRSICKSGQESGVRRILDGIAITQRPGGSGAHFEVGIGLQRPYQHLLDPVSHLIEIVQTVLYDVASDDSGVTKITAEKATRAIGPGCGP